MTVAFDPLSMIPESRPMQSAAVSTEGTDETPSDFASLLEMLSGAFAGLLGAETQGAAPPAPADPLPRPTGFAFGVGVSAVIDPKTETAHVLVGAAAIATFPMLGTDAGAPTIGENGLPEGQRLPPLAARAEEAVVAPALPASPPVPVEAETETPAAALAERPTDAAANARAGKNAAMLADPRELAAPQRTLADRTGALPSVASVAERAAASVAESAAGPNSNATPHGDANANRATDAGMDAEQHTASTAQHQELQNAARAPMPMSAEANAEALAIGRTGPVATPPGETAPPVQATSSQPEIPSRVTWLAQQGGGTARVALHPQELGEVEVSVRVRGRNVEVRFVADDPAAALAVTNAKEQLLEALGARDLRMDSFQVRSSDDAGTSREFAQSRHENDSQTRDEASRDSTGSGADNGASTDSVSGLAMAPGDPRAETGPMPTMNVISPAARGIDVRV